MARRDRYAPPLSAPRPAAPAIELGTVERGGLVHRLYSSLEPAEREGLLSAIGLKHAQRVGHRHKVAELRSLADLAAHWGVVDEWLAREDALGGPRAVGDLFDPLIRTLIERARELLGEHADEPTTEHMRVMAEALAAERSVAQARLLLAAVVEFDFTAAPSVLELASSDPTFALPTA